MAVMYVALNLLIDILYGPIDPRMRSSVSELTCPRTSRGPQAASWRRFSITRYILRDNAVTGFAFALFLLIVLAAAIGPAIAL